VASVFAASGISAKFSSFEIKTGSAITEPVADY